MTSQAGRSRPCCTGRLQACALLSTPIRSFATSSYLCVEPVTHVANAVNLANAGHDDTGLEVLQPGETLRGSMRFSASTI